MPTPLPSPIPIERRRTTRASSTASTPWPGHRQRLARHRGRRPRLRGARRAVPRADRVASGYRTGRRAKGEELTGRRQSRSSMRRSRISTGGWNCRWPSALSAGRRASHPVAQVALKILGVADGARTERGDGSGRTGAEPGGAPGAGHRRHPARTHGAARAAGGRGRRRHGRATWTACARAGRSRERRR